MGSQQQYRTSGGAGVEGSYGPTGSSSSTENNMGQAGDSSGISRTTGGAGVSGSYAPLMMAEGATKNMDRTEGIPQAPQHDSASPPCDLADQSSPASKALKAESNSSSSSKNDGGRAQGDASGEHQGSHSSYYKKLQSTVLPEAHRGSDQSLRSKL